MCSSDLGPHYCLGAFLARMQVETLFTAVLDRGLRLELAGPTARLRSNFGNGLKTMPVAAILPTGSDPR